MKNKWMLTGLAGLSLTCQYCQRTGQEKSQTAVPQKPNIILILTDDQGWGDLSVHGNKDLDTPNLDMLASESFRFNRFYVSPVSAPTRASLLTGRYHLRTGVHGVSSRMEVMRDSEYTLAEFLRSHDYATACLGKWHNGAQFPHNPAGQGFDYFFGFCGGHLNNYFDPLLELNGMNVRPQGYVSDILTDSAIQYIKEMKNKAFFLYLSFNAPHSPFQVPQSYFEKYKTKGFDDELSCIYAMVENLDHNIGRLREALEENELDENTILIFMTDNGPNSWRFNGGMKGKKAWVDEGGVRVPMFMKVPWKSNKSKDVDIVAAHIDLFPTLAEIGNLELPEGLNLDGISLESYMDDPGKKNDQRIIFTDQGLGSKIPFSLRNSEYVLSVGSDTALYNIILDPAQEINLGSEKPGLADSLLRLYEQWYQEVSRYGLKTESVQIGHKNFPVTKLPAHESIPGKNLEFMEGHGWCNDWIKNLHNPEDSLKWKLNVLRTGNYSLSILLDSPVDNVGKSIGLSLDDLSVKKIFEKSYVSKTVESPDRVPRQEAPERVWDTLHLESFKMYSGEAVISLYPVSRFNRNVQVKEIIIRSDQK